MWVQNSEGAGRMGFMPWASKKPWEDGSPLLLGIPMVHGTREAVTWL